MRRFPVLIALALALVVSLVPPAAAAPSVTIKRVPLAGSSTGCVKKSIALKAGFNGFTFGTTDPQLIAFTVFLGDSVVGRHSRTRKLSDPAYFEVEIRLDLSRLKPGRHKVFVGGVNYAEGDFIYYGSFTAVRCPR